MNEDLEDINEDSDLTKSINSRQDKSGNSSPIIDNSRPEESFGDLRKPKSRFESFESPDIPSPPSLPFNIKNDSKIDDPLVPIVVKIEDKKLKINLAQENEDLEEKVRREDSNTIADEILHTMLCELDNDKGINKALNQGENLEEMPSFLTRGIQTDTISVIEYLTKLYDKIRIDKESFLESLATPLNRDPLDILGHLQDVENDSNNSESENIPFQQSVLPVELYLEIERQNKKKENLKEEEAKSNRNNENLLDDSDEFEDNDSIMADWENIHNKVIFDWVNEILDNYRPYGLKGPPLTWSTNLRTLTYKYSEPERIDEVLFEAQDKIMVWADIEAGTLSNSETVINAPPEIREIMTETQFLTQIREERLANLLSVEINETEPLWLDYEYEETQVKLDLADMILQELCFDTIKEWNRLYKSDGIEEDWIDKIFEASEEKQEPPIILQSDKSPSNLPIKATAVGINIIQESNSRALNRSA